MGRPIRANQGRTRSRGTIRERVGQELEQLERVRRAVCGHDTYRRDPKEPARFICLDCGAPR